MSKNNEIDIKIVLVSLLKFYKSYKILIVVMAFIGIIIATADFYLGVRHYSSSFIVSTPDYDSRLIYRFSEPLNYFANNNSYDSLKNKMNISSDAAKMIKGFDIDTTIHNVLVVNVELYDTDYFSEVSKGYVYFLNSIPSVKSRIRQERESLNEFIGVVENEINQLNLYQENVIKKLSNNDIIEISSITGSFTELVELYNIKLDLKNQYNTLKSFNLIDSDNVFISKKSFKKNIVIYGFLGLIAGIFIGLFLDIRKLAYKYFDENK